MSSLATNKRSSIPSVKIGETKIEGICEGIYFPDDLYENAKVYFQIEFLKLTDNFVNSAFGEGLEIDPTLSITLPYPENVAQSFRYSYDSADLSFYRMAYDEGGDFINKVQAASQNGMSFRALRDMIGAGFEEGGDAVTYVGQYLTGTANETVGGLVGRGFNQIPNPNPSLFFQGVPLRTHSFVWQFIPKTEEESRTLHSMLKKFRQRITPKKKESFLTYPDLIQIKIMDDNGNDMSEKYGTKFLKSHVSSFNVNYTPAGTSAFYKDGYPAGVSLAIDIQEIEMYVDEIIDTGESSE